VLKSRPEKTKPATEGSPHRLKPIKKERKLSHSPKGSQPDLHDIGLEDLESQLSASAPCTSYMQLAAKAKREGSPQGYERHRSSSIGSTVKVKVPTTRSWERDAEDAESRVLRRLQKASKNAVANELSEKRRVERMRPPLTR
jgi:hypothetical protein